MVKIETDGLDAQDSERRRGEMERLQYLSAALLATDTVSEAAERAMREIVNLFGGGARLRIDGFPAPFQPPERSSADTSPGPATAAREP